MSGSSDAESPEKRNGWSGKPPRQPWWRSDFVLRWTFRVGGFLLAILLVVPLLPGERTPLLFPAMSPFLAIGSGIALRTLSWISLLAVPILLLAIWKKRCFCRYLCPMGLLHEAVGRFPLGRRLLRRIPNLAGILLWATILLAILQFPILLWLDPLALFTGLYRGHSYFVPAIFGLIILSSSLLLPGLWCMKICPLGALQDGVHQAARGVSKAISISSSRRQNEKIVDEATAPAPARRRFFFEVVFGGVTAGIVYALAARTQAEGNERNRLSLPGARMEPLFSSLCVRCGNCMTVCPTQILKPEKEVAVAWDGFGVPRVDFGTRGLCEDDCRLCTQVCPSGALASLSLAEKNRYKIGLARIEIELCVLYYDKECLICRRECPFDAIDYQWSQELYCQVPVVDEEKCNGCGACRPLCPGENKWEREESPSVPLRKAIEVFPSDSRK